MYLKIINPEKILFDQKIVKVTLPGKEGAFQVLNNHAPIISFLTKGEIKAYTSAKKPVIFNINNGVAKVNDNEIVVLI